MIRERTVGETSKFIDVLTENLGVIEISVKGCKKINSKNCASTQLFAYSKFCLKKRKDMYYINSAEPINIFYSLRTDLQKISLASYLSELVLYVIGSDGYEGNILKLFLNTLYFISNGKRPLELLKSIFEVRFMSEIGLMPNVFTCSNCSEYVNEGAYFIIHDGIILCEQCYSVNTDGVIKKISPSVLCALRHIILSEYNKLYNFKLSKESQRLLSDVTEQYVIIHLEKNFNTLNFYKSIV